MNIAIDGPCGAGKSTLARVLASKLGLRHLETGAMYRTVTLKLVKSNIALDDDDAMIAALDDIDIKIDYQDDAMTILLDGKDVTNDIRTQIISKTSTEIATLPYVREKMVEMQRKIATQGDYILDGRDIGTCVLPDCVNKFYVTASQEVRAERIHRDNQKRGKASKYDDVLEEVRFRDKTDMTREHGPLKKAKDATYIDNSHLSLNDTINVIISHLNYDDVCENTS